jgi:hypothetical protein
MRKYHVDTSRPRWVLAKVGDGPLADRMISYAESEELLTETLAADQALAAGEGWPAREIVRVVGADAKHFPLEGERPRYWESLHPAHELLGQIAEGIELYRRNETGELLIIDDTGPCSPELLGTIPAGLGPRPPDPDDAGVPEDDPRWEQMASADLAWLRQVQASSLSRALQSQSATRGWSLVQTFVAAGFEPHGSDDLMFWVADRAGRLEIG